MAKAKETNLKNCTTKCTEAIEHNKQFYCKLKINQTPKPSAKLTYKECMYFK